MIKLIASVDANFGIGNKGKLLFRDKADMAHFRETTIGHTVVMGRKTFEEIEKPLDGRRNVVLSGSLFYVENVSVIRSPVTAEILAEKQNVFIIGGGSLYSYFLPHADELILTHHSGSFEFDTFFPPIDGWNVYREKKLNDFLTVKYYKKCEK